MNLGTSDVLLASCRQCFDIRPPEQNGLLQQALVRCVACIYLNSDRCFAATLGGNATVPIRNPPTGFLPTRREKACATFWFRGRTKGEVSRFPAGPIEATKGGCQTCLLAIQDFAASEAQISSCSFRAKT